MTTVSVPFRRCRRLLAAGLLLQCLWRIAPAWSAASAPAAPRTTHVAGEVLIKFRPGTSPAGIDAIRRDLGASTLKRFPDIGVTHERITRLDVENAIARYRSDPRIEYIEPNYIVHALATPSDTLFPRLWALRNTGQTGGTAGADTRATEAWNVTTGSPGVLVAIIDSGMDSAHPDLAANVYVNPAEIPGNHVDDDHNGYIDDVHGWDFYSFDNDPFDEYGHGTHVAGTVGAVGNNVLGVAGVNWTVKLLPVRFLGPDGSGTDADAVAAIEYATRMSARIMNNSWGGGPYSQALHDAIAEASDHGILFVASAGNDARNTDTNPIYPADYDLPNVISVAATDDSDRLASFSNFGATSVDLAAPGVGILSTLPGGRYGTLSGTSMAAPHVTGALALILSRFPAIEMAGAKDLLLGHVDPIAGLAGKVVTGGRLDAFLPIAEADFVPPGAIPDLSVTGSSGDWVDLRWSATGDDGAQGTAWRYDVRYSAVPIDENSFGVSARASGAPAPGSPGTAETMRVGGLTFSTRYWFAVRAIDEVGNPGPISNVESVVTLPPPVLTIPAASLSADLRTGQSSTSTITLSNAGQSELSYWVRFFPTMPALPAQAAESGETAPVGTMRYAGTGEPAPGLIRSNWTSTALELAAIPAGNRLRLLLLKSGGSVSEVRDMLAVFPDVEQVDVVDVTNGGLLDMLGSYDAVIVINDMPFLYADYYGNVLADYVDRGGGLVLTLASFINNYSLNGRLLQRGYFPFRLGIGPSGNSLLGSYNASHPIMEGVSGIRGDALGNVTLAPGANLVASWLNGWPLVGTRGRRVAAVNLFFGNPAYWSGTVPLLIHNAAAWSVKPIVSVPGARDVLAPGGSVQLQVEFDAEGLPGGNYDGIVHVITNDPSRADVALPVTFRVTSAPDIAATPADLDFGSQFVGGARAESLTVENQGVDSLAVTSVLVSGDAYASPDTSLRIGPGRNAALIVRFSPQSTGSYDGTLRIESDDPDQPDVVVTLHGAGVPAPHIHTDSDSIDVTLGTGERTTRSLEIVNPGETALTWSVMPHVPTLPAPPAGTAPILVLSDTPIDNSVLSSLAGLGRSSEVRSTQDFTSVDFTGREVIIVALDNGSVDSSSVRALANAAAAGRLVFVLGGAPSAGYYQGVQSWLLAHTGQKGWKLSAPPHFVLEKADDPLGAGLPASATLLDPWAASYMLRISDPGAIRVARNGDGFPALVRKAIGSGQLVYFVNSPQDAYWADEGDFDLLRQVVSNTIALGPLPWLSTNAPASRTLDPGGTDAIELRFDGAQPPGDYLGNLRIASNDPLAPTLVIPVHMHVDVVTAADVALVGWQADPGRVRLTWHSSISTGFTAAVERREAAGGWKHLADVAPDGAGTIEYEDAQVLPGARYAYRLRLMEGGTQRTTREEWIDVPMRPVLALSGATPNPVVGDLKVGFTLPDGTPARLELLDLAGRRLRGENVGALGAGRHVVRLGPTAGLRPGVYLVRLIRGDRTLVTRCVVMK